MSLKIILWTLTLVQSILQRWQSMTICEWIQFWTLIGDFDVPNFNFFQNFDLFLKYCEENGRMFPNENRPYYQTDITRSKIIPFCLEWNLFLAKNIQFNGKNVAILKILSMSWKFNLSHVYFRIPMNFSLNRHNEKLFSTKSWLRTNSF